MDWTRWILMIVILGSQAFLSRRRGAYWGGILPLAFVVFMVVIYVRADFHHTGSFILALIGGLALGCGIWDNGRKVVKEKRNKELKKIELQDI